MVREYKVNSLKGGRIDTKRNTCEIIGDPSPVHMFLILRKYQERKEYKHFFFFFLLDKEEIRYTEVQ